MTFDGTLATYPHERVRLSCDKCGRHGEYRHRALIERFGENAKMPDVLAELAACPRKGNASDRCSAQYPDLVKI